jgi:hypothetical protein
MASSNTLTRRAFAHGGAAVAAATILPARSSMGQAPLKVRRSISDLIREQSPLIESYRRGVDAMMKRNITDKTSWWFQANIHDGPDDDYAKFPQFAPYWGQCPHRNYFFLSWHRLYLHFFERLVRKASGDPDFVLPYWSYDDPQQGSLPTAFLPDTDEFAAPGREAVPALARRNPLARATRLVHVDRRWIGLGDAARDCQTTLALDRFTATDKLDALQAFGGVRTAAPSDGAAAGGMEAAPHNLVHKTMGLEGDMGSPKTAARDPIFWLHHANVDRLWVKWTNPARGRIPPVDDTVWMTTKYRFVDEDGADREMTGAEVLDTQFQLGYRYDDDPPRAQRLDFTAPAVVLAPSGAPQAKALMRARAPDPVVLARGAAMRLSARESSVALASAGRPDRSQPSGKAALGPAPGRLRVVLRDVVAGEHTPPYDVFLALEGSSPLDAGTTAVRLGGLDLFGAEGGAPAHAHGGAGTGGGTIAFEAGAAVARLSRSRGYDVRRLRVSIVRRAYPSTVGGEYVPNDPDPPLIGAIELIQS